MWRGWREQKAEQKGKGEPNAAGGRQGTEVAGKKAQEGCKLFDLPILPAPLLSAHLKQRRG